MAFAVSAICQFDVRRDSADQFQGLVVAVVAKPAFQIACQNLIADRPHGHRVYPQHLYDLYQGASLIKCFVLRLHILHL